MLHNTGFQLLLSKLKWLTFRESAVFLAKSRLKSVNLSSITVQIQETLCTLSDFQRNSVMSLTV